MAAEENEQSWVEKELESLREQLRIKDEEAKEREEQLRKKDEEAKSREEELKRSEEARKSQEEKLRELRNEAFGAVGCVAEDNIKWQVEVSSFGEQYIYSPPKSIGGVPFHVGCKISLGRIYRGDHPSTKRLTYMLGFSPDNLSKTFAVCVSGTVSLRCGERRSGTECFDSASTSFDVVEAVCDWGHAVQPKYAKDGLLTIDASVKLIYKYKHGSANFSSSHPFFSDATLVVGEQEFAVNKIFLAHYSKYFRVIFFAPHADPAKERFEIPGFEAKEFEEFLRLIYPHRLSKLTRSNVKRMVQLADFFDCPSVSWKCIDFLKEITPGSRRISRSVEDISSAEKLELSDIYRLPELQHNVLESIVDEYDTKRIIHSSAFETLPGALKLEIYKRHVQLEEERRSEDARQSRDERADDMSRRVYDGRRRGAAFDMYSDR